MWLRSHPFRRITIPGLRRAAYSGLLSGLIGMGPGYDFYAPASRAEVCAALYNLLGEIVPLRDPIMSGPGKLASRAPRLPGANPPLGLDRAMTFNHFEGAGPASCHDSGCDGLFRYGIVISTGGGLPGRPLVISPPLDGRDIPMPRGDEVLGNTRRAVTPETMLVREEFAQEPSVTEVDPCKES